MPKNKVIPKNLLTLMAGALVFFCCTAVVSATYTVDFSPDGGAITAGQPITVTLNGASSGDTFNTYVVTAANSVTSYLPDFYLPFNMTGSSIAVSGTNVRTMSISVTAPAPDGNTYTRTNVVPPATLTNHATLYTGTYTNNGVTVTPENADTLTTVDLTVSGMISQYSGGSPQLSLQTNGATAGSIITVTVGGQSATYYISKPKQEGDTGGDVSVGNAAKGPTQENVPENIPVTDTGEISSGTLSADSIEGMSGATANWTTTITSQPSSGANITTTLSKDPSVETLAAFQSAYLVQGQGIDAVAYTMTVTKTGITSTGPATIIMSVPLSWVTSHGGLNAISIVRQGDDKTVTILTSTYTVDQGMVTFTAVTPENGLCVFTVVAIKSSTAAEGNATVLTDTTAAVSGSQTPPLATATTSAAATKTPLSTVIPLGALVIAMAGLALLKKH